MAKVSNMQIREQFITLRAQDFSFNQIADRLGVSRQTLMNWSKELEYDISNRRALELDALQEKYFMARSKRIELFGRQLDRLFNELENRTLDDLSTEKLFDLFLKYMERLKEESIPVTFKEQYSPDDEFKDLLEGNINVRKWQA